MRARMSVALPALNGTIILMVFEGSRSQCPEPAPEPMQAQQTARLTPVKNTCFMPLLHFYAKTRRERL